MPVEVRVSFPDIAKASANLQVALMKRIVDIVKKEAKLRAPHGAHTKGGLAASIFSRVSSSGTGTVGSKLPYAHLVHEGTRPHEIRPKGKHALAFKSAAATTLAGRSQYISAKSGRLVFSKKVAQSGIYAVVHHPGARANPFLRDALAASRDTIDWIITASGEQMLQEAIGNR